MKRVDIKSWAEFRASIDNDRQILPVYWRGQKDLAWPLASSFEREVLSWNGGWKDTASSVYPYDGRYQRNGEPFWADGYYQTMRDRYLNAFKRASEGLRGPNPPRLCVDEWWALGRNFHLVTPLLDWTESPYIAAFFALTELYDSMRRRAGIHFSGQSAAIYRLFHNEQLEGDGLRVLRPTVHELGRMHGQRGLFTWLDSERFFELQGFLDNTGRGDLLTQFVVSDQAVLDGLHDLKAHGIDYRLLYPDLIGAAKSANTLWDDL